MAFIFSGGCYLHGFKLDPDECIVMNASVTTQGSPTHTHIQSHIRYRIGGPYCAARCVSTAGLSGLGWAAHSTGRYAASGSPHPGVCTASPRVHHICRSGPAHALRSQRRGLAALRCAMTRRSSLAQRKGQDRCRLPPGWHGVGGRAQTGPRAPTPHPRRSRCCCRHAFPAGARAGGVVPGRRGRAGRE